MNDYEFSVENLIEWLETQPAYKKYDWSDTRKCVLGQWCKSKGMHGDSIIHDKSISLGGEDPFHEIALGDINRCTFGAALKRARAELSSATGVEA